MYFYIIKKSEIGASNEPWSEPTAWSSSRLYPWGAEHGDTDLMDEPESWWKYDRCTSLSLNGKAGALFFDQRHYKIHVSSYLIAYQHLNKNKIIKLYM